MSNLRYGYVERVLRRLLAPVLVRQEAALGQVGEEVRALGEQVGELARRMERIVGELNARQDDLTRVQEQLATELAGQRRRQDEIVRVQERLADEIRGVTQRHEDLVALQRNVMKELEGVQVVQKAIAETQGKLGEVLNECTRRGDDLVRIQEEQATVIRGIEDGHRALAKVQEELASRVQKIEGGHAALVKGQEWLVERQEQIFSCERELGRGLELLREDVKGVTRREDALVQVQEELGRQLQALWEEVGRIDQRVAGEAAQIEELVTRVGYGASVCVELQSKLLRLREEIDALKGAISGALEQLREKGSRRARVVKAELLETLDQLAYAHFEDDQRGSEEEIRGRLRWYLPWLRGVETTPESYVLDVGCGRGEFVELLLHEGFHVRGVDVNRVTVERARAKGLPVEQNDLFEVLRRVRSEALAGISAFHVLEHLPADMQIKFVRLAFAALRPGGVLMLEFPNILSLRVAATDFYKDPTHRRPLHPVTVEGWLRETGFKKIHVEFLHPYPQEECGGAHGALSEGVRMLCDVVFGNRDCAVVAVKGATTDGR